MQIVLARLDEGTEMVKAGRVDLGEMHTFRSVKIPVAVIWANDATDRDHLNAERYAKQEGYRVFCYNGEPDPLNRARRDVTI